jgi:hypothetical protein
MSYILIKGIHFWGGDIGSVKIDGYNNAINIAKAYINKDCLKCCNLGDNGNDNWTVWFK